MMQEIFKGGPIACSLYEDDSISDYTSFNDIIDKPGWNGTRPNHVIVVVGWGVQNGTKYWVVKNVEGIYGQDRGFFKMVRGKNLFLVE